MSSWHPDRRCHCQPVPTVTDADLMSTGLSPEGVVLLRVISKSLGGAFGGLLRSLMVTPLILAPKIPLASVTVVCHTVIF